ncbi:MAG: hypothetical protein K2J79_00265, partial [Ruminiclostridium sp.]|nr:hypothetical protein [Ruminiclostridium sp.]
MKTDKLLSLFMSVLIPFPLLLTGIVSTFEKVPLWAYAFGIAGAVVSWLCGRLMGGFLERAGKRAVYIVRALSVTIGIVLVVLCEIAVFTLRMGSLAPMFIPAAYVFWYWFGFRTGSQQRLISNMVLGGYGIEAAFMYPICASFNRSLAFYIILLTALLTVLGALLINFRQVSGLSLRGKSENRLLSRACTRFNVKTTLIFCGIILFAFFFCGVGAKWLWEGIKAVIRYFIYLMVWLGSLMDSGGDFELGNDPNSPPFQITENRLGIIFLWIAYIVLAVIAFKPLMKALKRLYQLIMSKLGRERALETETEYTDIYQETDRKSVRDNTFKKAFKAFMREKDLQKKFRLGYKAFMAGLKAKELELLPSDTPNCHLEKGNTLTQSENLCKTVEKYYGVRYD